jgi:hypothetical protein
MSKTEPLPTLGFSDAKNRLSEVMDDVVREGLPTIVRRGRQRKEQMLLLSRPLLDHWLRTFRFEPTVVMEEGEVTAALDRFGLLGFGTTFDEALDDLVARLREHVSRYFARAGPMSWQAPWLLRFALTPPEQQRDLLSEPLPDSVWTLAAG